MATPTTLPAAFVSGNVLEAAQLNNLRGAFRVLQVASATKANSFSTASSTFVDVTDLSVSLTPSATSSKVLVTVTVQGAQSSADTIFLLRRDSTDIALSTAGSSVNGFGQASGTYLNSMFTVALTFLDSPSSTSATTYKIQMRTVNGGTAYVNRRGADATLGGFSSITVMEISA